MRIFNRISDAWTNGKEAAPKTFKELKDGASKIKGGLRDIAIGAGLFCIGFTIFVVSPAGSGWAFAGQLINAVGIFGGGIIAPLEIVSGLYKTAIKAPMAYAKESTLRNRIEKRRMPSGQTLQGPRWALLKITAAQNKINRLTDAFKNASTMSKNMHARADAVIASAKDAIAAVKVTKNPKNDDTPTVRFTRKRQTAADI